MIRSWQKTFSGRLSSGALALCAVCVCSRSLFAQEASQSPAPGRQLLAAALESDKCPVVAPGGTLSLDWNPGFEHLGVVTGLRVFQVKFVRVAENGTVISRQPIVLGGRSYTFTASTLPNGYFHVEFPLSRQIAVGQYRLTAAEGTAQALPEYQGAAIRMTHSPADERFCFTVQPHAASTP